MDKEKIEDVVEREVKWLRGEKDMDCFSRTSDRDLADQSRHNKRIKKKLKLS